MGAPDFIGQTQLDARTDGVEVSCQICGRNTHLGAVVATTRDSIPPRKVTLTACYDCLEVCHVAAVCRIKCGHCDGTGERK